MKDLALRLQRLRPAMRAGEDFVVLDDSDGRGQYLQGWDKRFDPIPTDDELLAVDLSKPTPAEKERLDDLEILKAAVKDESVPRWAKVLMRQILKGGE